MTEHGPAFSEQDRAHMALAIELARGGIGMVSPNPLVGSVITSPSGDVIGRGAHLRYGEAHAEPNAIADAEARGASVRGGTIYVTLEPHSHASRTPPCCDLIVEKGLARCVVAAIDPNPNVCGEGISRMRAGGLQVDVGLLEDEARDLARFFFKHVTSGLPFVTLKIASSLDGRSALASGEARWITSEASRRAVHAMRAEHDVVMVGTRTAYLDDPELTVRHVEGRQPFRLVLDRELRLPLTMKLFTDEFRTRTIVATSEVAAAGEKAAYLRSVGLEVLTAPTTEMGLSIEPILRILGSRGLTSVLVEAGPTLSGTLVREGLADEIALMMAPMVLGGDARPTFDALDLRTLADAPRYRLQSVRRVEPSDDIYVRLRKSDDPSVGISKATG